MVNFLCLMQAAKAVVKNGLSLIIFPEGTRSKNGRLLPFKKARSIKNFSIGFVHFALQTRLPIVPIVLMGKNLRESQRPSVSADLVGSCRTLSS
ncbi:1-acyl-sn-glycerol-3-phosphate acyltransferase-like [Dorcoceras hygrometricum]|uniref:1-acyl-sn-glycerol-3-phosphate acyltransferase-like n=1 Tax=Dorcoceras hygrometricum TaxID=472368 RepID=A0A2Z7DDJ7_9LAMI|nr:1-acyl-sn-glycerol-3-phosphate acyltransferase-like [Dorcoceras hygrometricum]